MYFKFQLMKMPFRPYCMVRALIMTALNFSAVSKSSAPRYLMVAFIPGGELITPGTVTSARRQSKITVEE